MEPIIQVKQLSKIYTNKKNVTEALKDINLDIYKGNIYGIIGMSGAGKSTLVRCLNFLERPSTGTVLIEGRDLWELSPKELRKTRMDIAMIFQHFNLLMQKNVLDNICLPLEIAGLKKKEARKRAEELLKIVGLSDKAKAYPSQLSGGQKQRVAIARALSNNPKILLCDEATSALDPQTTQSILDLLREINAQYGITIVIITHEMSVVEQICTHVAIVDNGTIVESGKVIDVFSAPQSKEGKKLVIKDEERIMEMQSRHCVRVVFKENSAFEPVIGNMILEFRTPVNILLADTKNINGTAAGEMILQLPEKEDVAKKMIAYLLERKLTVEEVKDYV